MTNYSLAMKIYIDQVHQYHLFLKILELQIPLQSNARFNLATLELQIPLQSNARYLQNIPACLMY
jgi:hypothetical protein